MLAAETYATDIWKIPSFATNAERLAAGGAAEGIARGSCAARDSTGQHWTLSLSCAGPKQLAIAPAACKPLTH
jgi:hypothetical protein